MSALTWKRKSRLVLGSQPSTNSGSKGNLEAFLMERLLRQSKLCEDVNSLAAPVAKKSLMERVRSCLFCSTRSKTTIRKISTMKLTTIGLALALALASKIALAEGTLNYSLPVVRGLAGPGPRRSGLRTSPPGIRSPLMRDPRGQQ